MEQSHDSMIEDAIDNLQALEDGDSFMLITISGSSAKLIESLSYYEEDLDTIRKVVEEEHDESKSSCPDGQTVH